MFNKWLRENKVSDFSFSNRLFPPASDRGFWEGVMNQSHIASAEKYLGYEWPLIRATQFMEFQKSGDRMAQETPHFDRRHALLSLTLGEIAEHRGRFLPDIVDGIFAICEESYWGVSAHSNITRQGELIPDASDPYIDILASDTAELISVIYHILYDEIHRFCPELLHRMEYELDRRIVTPYLTRGDFWWMGNTGSFVNNWNPWVISNILTVFLVTGLRRTQLEDGIRKMFKEINRYYDSIPSDGGCDEGASYWALAGGKLLSFCDLLYIASGGRINFFGDEKLRRIGHYAVKAYIGGCYFVNFADGNSMIRNTCLDYELYSFGLRTGDQSLCRLAGTLKRQQNYNAEEGLTHRNRIKSILFSLIYAGEIDAQPPFVPEERYVLPDLNCAFIRSGYWFYAAKGGHNGECHNHNDVGNCIVYYDGQPLLIDVGCGTYTARTFSGDRYSIWTMQSGWHNLPVINGVEQRNGREYRAESFTVSDTTTTVSYAKAYPETAGVSKVTREVRACDDGITITERLDFDGDTNTVEEHFHTLLKPEVTDEGVVIGGRYLLKTDLGAAVDWKDFEGDRKLMDAWGSGGVYRIRLLTTCTNHATIKMELRGI